MIGPLPNVLGTLEREEVAYTARGSQRRRFTAYCPQLDKVVTGRAGIADTYFTVPAHVRVRGRYVPGYLTSATLEQEDRGLPDVAVVFCIRKNDWHKAGLVA